MRTAFLQTLCALADADPRIWLLCGDLGYSVLEDFAARFPDRFCNVGIAEQNMTGVAAGLAMDGNIVFTYSIANFPLMRCFEQLRNDVCYQNLNVKVVAVGGGVAYGAAGYSHHAVEDLAVTRVLPHMMVVAPGDPVEAALATRAIAAAPGPCYLRIGKAGEAPIHATPPAFRLGQAITVRAGDDVTLMSTGGMLGLICQAADALRAHGIAARVISMPTIHPFDQAAVLDAAHTTGGLITVEEHGPGGLAAVVGETLARAGIAIPFHPLHLPREPLPTAGSQHALCQAYGLTVDAVVRVAMGWCEAVVGGGG